MTTNNVKTTTEIQQIYANTIYYIYVPVISLEFQGYH